MVTQDILYIVLMFCALWLTMFICWLIYQVVSVVRRANEVLEGVERKIDLVERSFNALKMKVETGMGVFATVAGGLKSVMEMMRKEK